MRMFGIIAAAWNNAIRVDEFKNLVTACAVVPSVCMFGSSEGL
jgi:hypothetical protein